MIKALLYGLLEGVTEWLPISSTGHLILLEKWLPMTVSDQFMALFRVVIQLGAILAVVQLGFKTLWPFRVKPSTKRPYLDYWTTMLWVKIVIACLPAAIIGLAFDEWIDKHLYTPVVVSIALIVFGLGFLWVENRQAGQVPRVTRLNQISFKDALIIGLFQVLAAIFPGTSRSGATILGGLMLGLSRPVAAEFTFFLGIPVMLGASLLKVVKIGLAFSLLEWILLVLASVTAYVTSLVVIRFLLSYIKHHDFKVFGWYRIILGLVVLVYFMIF